MRPAPFTYHRPRDIAEALSLLADLGDDAKVIAGGQSLVPMLALRLATPAHLIDLRFVAELHAIERRDAILCIGANVTQRRAEGDERTTAVPLLGEALPLIAHPAIRNRGTVCGSIAHADSAAELPAVTLALDAVIVVRSTRGVRRIAASDFFVSYLQTALAADEIIVAVEFPIANSEHSKGPSGAAFCEITRRHGDFAVVGVAVSVTLDAGGCVERASVALSGVASTPVRIRGAELALVGAVPDEQRLTAAADAARSALDPPGDVHATADYRRHVSGVLVQRAVRAAYADALERREGSVSP